MENNNKQSISEIIADIKLGLAILKDKLKGGRNKMVRLEDKKNKVNDEPKEKEVQLQIVTHEQLMNHKLDRILENQALILENLFKEK